MSFNCI